MPRSFTLSTAIAAVALVPLWLASSGDANAQRVLKIHHQLPASAPVQKILLEPFARAIERDTNGRLKIQIFPQMQLGGAPPQIYDQVKDGVVDIGWTLPGYTGGRFPLSALFELPFMITTAEATTRAFQEFGAKHLAQKEYADTHPLLFHVAARMKFHLRKGPITSIEDFKGLRIRATHKSMGDALEAYGATPIFMPVPQVPASLQRGVVDGAVIPWEVVVPLRVYELVSYHSLIETERGFIVPAFVLTMNKKVYESLEPDLKAAIDKNSGANIAQKIGKAYDEVEQVGYELAKKRGNKFNVIDPAEVERMVKLSEPVRREWIAAVTAKGYNGLALMDEANALINGYTNVAR